MLGWGKYIICIGRSVCLSVCVFVCLHIFSRTVAVVDTKLGLRVCATGTRHSKSLEQCCQKQRVYGGRIHVQCGFLVYAESGVYQTWIHVCG